MPQSDATPNPKPVAPGRIAILGYGSQGRAQALNLRDHGFDVVVGQRQGSTRFAQAQADGFVWGTTLFDPATAAQNADTLYYLFSDFGQMEFWPTLKPLLTPGKTLVFAHGFSVVYAEQTGVVPPAGIDVLLVAPKGLGLSVRQKFVDGQEFCASYAVFQDASGVAWNKARAHAYAIGAKKIFETTFAHEVFSDLVSERGVILGGLMALLDAQFQTLRQNGHSAEEAFNDTVSELTDWLADAIGRMGYDGLLPHCSETAQIGALQWRDRFFKALQPIFADLYQSVAKGLETQQVLNTVKTPKLREQHLQKIADLSKSELWTTAKRFR